MRWLKRFVGRCKAVIRLIPPPRLSLALPGKEKDFQMEAMKLRKEQEVNQEQTGAKQMREQTRDEQVRTVAGVVNSIETLEGGGFLVRRPFPQASFSEF